MYPFHDCMKFYITTGWVKVEDLVCVQIYIKKQNQSIYCTLKHKTLNIKHKTLNIKHKTLKHKKKKQNQSSYSTLGLV